MNPINAPTSSAAVAVIVGSEVANLRKQIHANESSDANQALEDRRVEALKKLAASAALAAKSSAEAPQYTDQEEDATDDEQPAAQHIDISV